jgi:hypothetical protein
VFLFDGEAETPVVGQISSSSGGSDGGARTYAFTFEEAVGNQVIMFMGTITVFPNNIGISGQLTAHGMTGQVRGSDDPIIFDLYSENGNPVAPPETQADGTDGLFSALTPHGPLMIGKN